MADRAMAANEAYEGQYRDLRAVWLKAGRYEAAVLPDVGANLIAFRDTERNYAFLREPDGDELTAFLDNPGVHGFPVLFPPNRFEDGKFPWEGVVHRLSVNEPARNNRLHGFVHNIPWQVEGYGADALAARVTLSVTIDESHPVHIQFPFVFTIRLEYTLDANGLAQRVLVRNTGRSSLPCLIGFHTAVRAPFAPGSAAADCRLKLTIGERWEMGAEGRMLPTGRRLPLTPAETAMRDGTQSPFFEALDNHYTAAPQDGRNRMELTDSRVGVTLVYDVGTGYKQWMIWNDGARGGFFCPEPQTNAVNAPNLPLKPEEKEQAGLIALAPGEIWEETSRMYTIG